LLKDSDPAVRITIKKNPSYIKFANLKNKG
jgi:hypothetical protein